MHGSIWCLRGNTDGAGDGEDGSSGGDADFISDICCDGLIVGDVDGEGIGEAGGFSGG